MGMREKRHSNKKKQKPDRREGEKKI